METGELDSFRSVLDNELNLTAGQFLSFQDNSEEYLRYWQNNSFLIHTVLKMTPPQLTQAQGGKQIQEALQLLLQMGDNNSEMLSESRILCGQVCKFVNSCLKQMNEELNEKGGIFEPAFEIDFGPLTQIKVQKQKLENRVDELIKAIEDVKLQQAISEQCVKLQILSSRHIPQDEQKAIENDNSLYLSNVLSQQKIAIDAKEELSKKGEEIDAIEKHLRDLDDRAKFAQSEIYRIELERQTELVSRKYQKQLKEQNLLSMIDQAQNKLVDLFQHAVNQQIKQVPQTDKFDDIQSQINMFSKTIQECIQNQQVILEKTVEDNYECALSKAFEGKELTEQKMFDKRMILLNVKSQQDKLRSQLENEEKQLLIVQANKPAFTIESLEKYRVDQQVHLNEQGFSSLSALSDYQKDIDKCRDIQFKLIKFLRQILENVQNAYETAENLQIVIQSCRNKIKDLPEQNIFELRRRWKQVLNITGQIDPVQLVIQIIGQNISNFEQKIDNLSHPELFREMMLAPLLSGEMWPAVKKLVYDKSKDPKKEVTFDEYSRDILFRLYGSTDAELKKRQHEFNFIKNQASFIEDQIEKAEEKKASIQENLQKQLTSLQEKLDKEFEKKTAKVGGDSNKVQELEEAKAEQLSASTEKEEEKAQKDSETLEKNIEKFQGDLEVAEEKKLEAQMSLNEAKNNFFDYFQKEHGLIKNTLQIIRTSTDELNQRYSKIFLIKPLLKFTETTVNNCSFMLPKQIQA